MGFYEHVDMQVQPGGVVILDAGEQHLNKHGTVHGGVLATMIDTAMGAAVAEGTDKAPVTVSLTVTYLEPGQQGRLEARAQVRKRGKRLTVVEAEVVQDGDVLADALATFATLG